MSFREAVAQTPNLETAWRNGLRALRRQDRRHIEAEDPRRLRGSADVDKALQRVEPQANRWDFAIAYQHTNVRGEFIYWVETHTGTDQEIEVVRKKHEWLRNWLAREGRALSAENFPQEFYWVPSGATAFTKGAKQVKILAQEGIIYTGSILRIRNDRAG